jgi:hypothetical protein
MLKPSTCSFESSVVHFARFVMALLPIVLSTAPCLCLAMLAER